VFVGLVSTQVCSGVERVGVSALVTTTWSGAAAAVSWMLMDWFLKGKPSALHSSCGCWFVPLRLLRAM